MRTASQIALVLIGGGALGYGVAASMDTERACREARARGDMAEATVIAAGSPILGTLNAACLS